MKKTEIKQLESFVYTEELENGLKIFMIPYEDKENYYISYATHFGSDILEFEVDNKSYKPPLGIAHFLEHKLFEQEDGTDPFTFFSKSGTDANASTSFDNTQYICYGTNDFSKNLRYLLDFVNSPYFTDENVEKEKGIIAEEIKMYDDMPDVKLERKTRENVYQKSPRRIDIAGSIKEINKITKEDLYKCYKSFYVPNNMFVLILGKFDPEEAVKIIKEEVGYKNKVELPVIKKVEEKTEVHKKIEVIKENIDVPKLSIGIKIKVPNTKMKKEEIDLYYSMITTALFGSSSEFRERVRNKKLLNSIYTEWEDVEEYKVFYLMAASMDQDKLMEEIEYELNNLSITNNTFERIKKVWIANEVKMIDHINATVNNSYDDILRYGRIITNRIELIRNMKMERLNQIIEKTDWTNRSIVKMIKKG